MVHSIYRVTSLKILAPCMPQVEFNDYTTQKIDPEVHTPVWPNGTDFDPTTLHDWHEISSMN